jgi:hypothetical protein
MRANRSSTKAKWVDRDDAPEVSAADLQRGTWRIRGKRVTSTQGRAALRQALKKK